MAIRDSHSDKAFAIINVTILTLITLIVLYPLVFCVSASFSSTAALAAGDVVLFPVRPNLTSYRAVFRDNSIWVGYRNTTCYTILYLIISLTATIITAYPLSRRDLKGRNVFMLVFTFTMFFSGGIIPTYLVIKNLKMLNTVWAIVLPGCLSVTNLIITRTYFMNSIPFELQESAMIDGSSNIGTLLRIVMPLSKPIIAVMAVYYGVAMWNSYFSALMYLTDTKKWPLQLVLRELLLANMITEVTDSTMFTPEQILLYEGMKYALVVVASLPVMCLYPFVQRFFVKGVMIGAIKG